jgi:hypothetical protein
MYPIIHSYSSIHIHPYSFIFIHPYSSIHPPPGGVCTDGTRFGRELDRGLGTDGGGQGGPCDFGVRQVRDEYLSSVITQTAVLPREVKDDT